jgi:hypothetical protein
MVHTVKSMYLDIIGKRKPALQGRVQQVDEKDGAETPHEKVDVVFSKKE